MQRQVYKLNSCNPKKISVATSFQTVPFIGLQNTVDVQVQQSTCVAPSVYRVGKFSLAPLLAEELGVNLILLSCADL